MENPFSLTQDHYLFGILDRITDGFYAIDLNGIVLYWNKAAEEMLGNPGMRSLVSRFGIVFRMAKC